MFVCLFVCLFVFIQNSIVPVCDSESLIIDWLFNCIMDFN